MFMTSLPVAVDRLFPSCPGIAVRRTASLPLAYARASTSLCSSTKLDVDGRDEPGHDGVGPIEFIRLPLSRDDLIIQGENAATFCQCAGAVQFDSIASRWSS